MAEPTNLPVNAMDWARAYLSDEEYAEAQAVIAEPLPISIRINSLKWEPQAAANQLAGRYAWTLAPVPFCADGFRINKAHPSPGATIEHRLGYFYIQEAASMLPPVLFDLQTLPDPLILDMAASPGGKTTHLAALTGDRGLLIANDGSRARIPTLQTVLRNWGAINQCVTCLPGEAFGGLHPNTFDAVLLDAPCSMQGLRAAESHTSRPVTAGEVDSLAARQVRLLESALRAAKVGGQVVYSTCTLAPQEDELVLAVILDKFSGCVQIEDVSARLSAPAPALTQVNGLTLPQEIIRAVRLWPHTLDTAGFFAARLTKTVEMPETRSALGWGQAGKARFYFSPLPASLAASLVDWVRDQYGFDLADLIDQQRLALAAQKERVFLLPRALLKEPGRFPFLSAGMEIGRQVRTGLIPSHEFFARFADQFTRGRLLLEDHFYDPWTRGEDVRGYPMSGVEKGLVYAVRDEAGRNLGRGKALADRLKNMLPTRLF